MAEFCHFKIKCLKFLYLNMSKLISTSSWFKLVAFVWFHQFIEILGLLLNQTFIFLGWFLSYLWLIFVYLLNFFTIFFFIKKILLICVFTIHYSVNPTDITKTQNVYRSFHLYVDFSNTIACWFLDWIMAYFISFYENYNCYFIWIIKFSIQLYSIYTIFFL